jgi:transposase
LLKKGLIVCSAAAEKACGYNDRASPARVEAAMLPDPDTYPAPDALDEMIFAATVPADHYLRRVQAVLDFECFREELAACYSPDQGRPAKEPLLLLKLEFLQYHYNLSDRLVVEQARSHMAYRWFLGLSLRSPLPHPSLLTVFRDRLGVARHQRIFDALVAQGRQHGLVKDRLRLKDATHLIANIAVPSAVRLVAQTREQLLAALRPYAPEQVVHEEAEAARIHTATADLSGEERLLQRVTHLRALVAWVEAFVDRGHPAGRDEPAWWILTAALQQAHKVLADREPGATDRLVSGHDPDARHGDHHGPFVGYILDVAMDADSEFITALNVLPASGNEVQDTSTLIRHEEQVHGNDVQAVSLDALGCRGEQLREWTDRAGLNLEVFVPPRAEPPAPAGFPAEQFTPSETEQTLTCPAGQTSQRRVRNRHDTGWVYRWARGVCAACPLQRQCVEHLGKDKGRHVTTNDYAAEYAAARAKAQTPAYREVRRQHRAIERKLSEVVRWQRARRARYRGQPRVLLQALLTGLVVNIRCLVRHLTAPPVRAELTLTG